MLFCVKSGIITGRVEAIPINTHEMEVMTVLMGKYNHAIDSKGRLIIPAKLKDQLGAVITVLKWTDNCLRMYSAEEWAIYAAKISAMPGTKSRAITRYLYSNAMEVIPDAQGRVILPQEMLEFAGITKNVITAGCGLYAEIWAAERWEENNLNDEPENFTDFLEEMGL